MPTGDLGTFTLQLGQAGDFSGDGRVDQDDLTMLLSNWGGTVRPSSWLAPWDGLADQNELTDLLSNWGAEVSASTQQQAAAHDAALETTETDGPLDERADQAADALWFDYCQRRKDEKRIVGPLLLDPILLNGE